MSSLLEKKMENYGVKFYSLARPLISNLLIYDDSPWDKEGFRLKNIQIRRTVSWKIACILAPHSTLVVNSILTSIFNVFGRLAGGGEINKR